MTKREAEILINALMPIMEKSKYVFSQIKRDVSCECEEYETCRCYSVVFYHSLYDDRDKGDNTQYSYTAYCLDDADSAGKFVFGMYKMKKDA